MAAGQQTQKKIALLLTHAGLLFFSAITLIPFVWLVCGSVKKEADFLTSTFLPIAEDGTIAWGQLTLDNFRDLFTQLDFSNHLFNSVFLASTIALLATLFAAMGGYALAKFEFRGRSFFTGLILAALIIPGPLLLAPGYQLLYDLKLLDTYWALILPSLAPAFGVFLFRQSMLNTIPKELQEAARIDGCGEFRLFFQVVLPLVRPMVGAFMMITFLGTWNNFIGPQIVLSDPELAPLTVAIAQLQGVYQTNYGMLAAGNLVSIAPVMCIFLLMQREFISGLTSGAVKG